MKTPRSALQCLGLASALLLAPACTEAPQSQTPAPMASDPLLDAHADALLETYSRIGRGFQEFDQEIARLRRQIEADSANAAGPRAMMTDLAVRRQAIESDLDRLSRATPEHFEAQRDSIETRWNLLVQDLEAVHLMSLDTRSAFEDAIAARLDELEMEIADARRYAAYQGGSGDPIGDAGQPESIERLASHLENLSLDLDSLRSVPDDEFEALRLEVAGAVADFGARVRKASDDIRTASEPGRVVNSRLE
ncbi:MAG: hypothetical protein R2834_15115 [Rhodothermales bacterium]